MVTRGSFVDDTIRFAGVLAELDGVGIWERLRTRCAASTAVGVVDFPWRRADDRVEDRVDTRVLSETVS
jgi:hypothetical protein